jgi:microcystin degradation protein MlrC
VNPTFSPEEHARNNFAASKWVSNGAPELKVFECFEIPIEVFLRRDTAYIKTGAFLSLFLSAALAHEGTWTRCAGLP